MPVCICGSVLPAVASAQSATVSGVVLDQLGARLPGATVTLVGEQQDAGNVTSGSDGSFTFANVRAGPLSRARAQLSGFETTVIGAVLRRRRRHRHRQRVAGGWPAAAGRRGHRRGRRRCRRRQTGAPVTVIDQQVLDALNKPDVLEALRLTPGTNIQQTGGRGGNTSIFLRGGNSNFTKVLIDGVSANDIGGGVDLAQLQTTGVGRIEVLRQSNSVIYGSDALTGVVSIETRRGRTRVPELLYTLDGGNFGTVHTDLGVGGAVKRFDYFSDYSFFDTDNEVPNNGYRNHTYAGRFGVALGGGTDLSGTIRHIDAKYGNPNAFDLFQIADDSTQKNRLTFGNVAASSQWTNRVQSSVRFGMSDQTTNYLNPTGTGTYVDPFGFGGNYVGNVVTITGANGYSVTGRGILDYAFSPFPSTFDSRTARKTLSGQATVQVATNVQVSGGARYEREQGYDDPEADPSATRDNGGVFVEGRARAGRARLRQRRRRLRAQRGLQDRRDAARVGGGLPARSHQGRGGRHQADVQRRQGHQGAGALPGAELALRPARVGPGVRARERRSDRSRAQHQRGRRHRAGVRRRAGARAPVVLPQRVRRPDRVREPRHPAARGRVGRRRPRRPGLAPTSTRSRSRRRASRRRSKRRSRARSASWPRTRISTPR